MVLNAVVCDDDGDSDDDGSRGRSTRVKSLRSCWSNRRSWNSDHDDDDDDDGNGTLRNVARSFSFACARSAANPPSRELPYFSPRGLVRPFGTAYIRGVYLRVRASRPERSRAQVKPSRAEPRHVASRRDAPCRASHPHTGSAISLQRVRKRRIDEPPRGSRTLPGIRDRTFPSASTYRKTGDSRGALVQKYFTTPMSRIRSYRQDRNSLRFTATDTARRR